LAVIIPTLFIGGFLLRNAGEAVVQVFVMGILFLGIAIIFVLEERAKRRRRDQ
jgi:hypothetical protein